MIKVNLLPKYYGEGRRITITIIVCVVILLIEAVPVLKVPADYKLWTDWFAGEKSFYPTYQKKAEDEIAVTEKWKGDAGTYTTLLEAFSRNKTQEYNNDVVKVLIDVASRVGGRGAWFDEMTVQDDKVVMKGQIKGLMNFVNYYLRLSKDGLSLEPTAELIPNAMDRQIIAVNLSGTLKKSMPTQPSFTFVSVEYNKLYVPKGSTAEAPANIGGGGAAAGGAATDPAAAGGAAGAAPGGAPGAAPGGAPASPGGAPAPSAGTPPPGTGGPPAKTN